MLLQHIKARPHISAAASAAMNSTGSEVIPHLSIAWIWHCDFWFIAVSQETSHRKSFHTQ